MKEVKLSFTTNGFFKVLVDGKGVSFMNGKGKVMVREELDIPLQWVVRDAPGAKYAIEILGPPEAKFKHEAVLDMQQRDAGLHWFRVNA